MSKVFNAMQSIHAQLTPNSVGIVLSGSESDLIDLYDAIYQAFPEDDSLDADNVLFLLGLTYDIRKAYSGHRDEHLDIQPINPKTSDECEINKTYSVAIVLPILIAQIHILSEYLAFFLGDETAYNTILNFKNKVLSAIEVKSKDTYEKVKYWLENTDDFSEDYIFNIITHFSAVEYIQYKPKEKRLQSLPGLLETFNELNQKYIETAKLLEIRAKGLNCSVHDLIFDVDDEIFEQLDSGKISW